VGVAIPARFGSPFAALSVSALSSRMLEGQRFRKIVRWLEAEVKVIASKLREYPAG
jgi:DNA-binding IclR family transcriptional regulator